MKEAEHDTFRPDTESYERLRAELLLAVFGGKPIEAPVFLALEQLTGDPIVDLFLKKPDVQEWAKQFRPRPVEEEHAYC